MARAIYTCASGWTLLVSFGRHVRRPKNPTAMPSEAFGGNTADEVACVVTFMVVWRRLNFFSSPSLFSLLT